MHIHQNIIIEFAEGVKCSVLPTIKIFTLALSFNKWRAAAKPSPPLFPQTSDNAKGFFYATTT